jgi:serine phosphatase RsbU (regulator of sigma subunit)
MFGFERLIASFQKLHQLQNPVEIIEQLLTELRVFVGEAEQHDDITLVVVQVEDDPNTASRSSGSNTP